MAFSKGKGQDKKELETTKVTAQCMDRTWVESHQSAKWIEEQEGDSVLHVAAALQQLCHYLNQCYCAFQQYVNFRVQDLTNGYLFNLQIIW